MSCQVWRRVLKFGSVLVVIAVSAVTFAETPCATGENRALVLSGGGVKGAFEAGAIYHLVIDRGCDFQDFAGVSVGALNAAMLSQAAPSDDPAKSLDQLKLRTEAMVALWESFRNSRQIMRPRHFAAIGFALFGADSMNDFAPLRQILKENVSPERLASGRPLRIGVTSFWDGSYREIAIGGQNSAIAPNRFMEFLHASSIMPVIGRMPRIASDEDEPNNSQRTQFTDGSLREVTPVASYFVRCWESPAECHGNWRVNPPHASLQQLFVVVTSPYERGSDVVPVTDNRCCRRGTKIITKGSRILIRALGLMVDAPYRRDLDSMFFANEVLEWRSEMQTTSDKNVSHESQLHDQSRMAMFPVESYNLDPSKGLPASRPYLIALVKPEKEAANITNLLSLSQGAIREQLLSGCLAANDMMSSRFGLPRMDEACKGRFSTDKQRTIVSRAEHSNVYSRVYF
jgi:Patatin-like phospholipase